MDNDLKEYKIISAPKSKSEFHRALFAAALSPAKSKIFGGCDCADASETVTALTALGVKIEKTDDCLLVDGSGLVRDREIELYINESATTLRFLLPILAARNLSGKIFVGNRLYVRFNDDDVKFYDEIGVKTVKQNGCIRFFGKIEKNSLTVSAKNTSQNLSGLLLALPNIFESSEITVQNAVSTGYVRLTLETLEKFGIKHRTHGSEIHLFRNYRPCNFYVSGDFSAAANFALFGAIKNSVQISGLSASAFQPDKVFTDILANCGVKCFFENQTLFVNKAETLRPFVADLTDTPDLFPVCAVLAAFSTGTSALRGTNRLTNKESDRLLAIEYNLSEMGVKYVSSDNVLQIFGGSPKRFLPNSFSDHRIAMAFSIAAAALSEKPIPDDCVRKSYPNFFSDLERLCQN